MFGKLSVALLFVAAPAVAQETPPPDPQEAEAVTDVKVLPYKLKKVCRAQEVVGSAIPRTVCTTKRIYLKPGEEGEADKSAEQTQPQL